MLFQPTRRMAGGSAPRRPLCFPFTRRNMPRSRRARMAEFVQPDQCDLPSPVSSPKIFHFAPDPNHSYIPHRPVPQRGVSRSSRTRGGMRWTWTVLLTRAPFRGRRSRVVLTPRRRRQVGGSNSAGDGDKQARSPGRARRKPLKPSRAGMPGDPGATVVTNARVFYTPRAAAGATGTRHSPRPLLWAKGTGTTRAHRVAGSRCRDWLCGFRRLSQNRCIRSNRTKAVCDADAHFDFAPGSRERASVNR
jgi:hypothetical protein